MTGFFYKNKFFKVSRKILHAFNDVKKISFVKFDIKGRFNRTKRTLREGLESKQSFERKTRKFKEICSW